MPKNMRIVKKFCFGKVLPVANSSWSSCEAEKRWGWQEIRECKMHYTECDEFGIMEMYGYKEWTWAN